MKKFVSTILAVLLLVSFTTLASVATAKENSLTVDMDYQTIFEDFLNSDGAYAEIQSERVYKSYVENPEKFFAALSERTSEEITSIAYALIYGEQYDLNIIAKELSDVKEEASTDVRLTVEAVEEIVYGCIHEYENYEPMNEVRPAVSAGRN